MIRWVKRVVGLVLLFVAVLFAPVAYTELACSGDGVPIGSSAGSILAPEHHRPVARTLMTYPEWHIVHAYDDYAKVIEDGDPHEFGFLPAIRGFWSSLCELNIQASSIAAIDPGTKQMVYTIGISFTAELALKAAYEETFGRFFALLRGEERSPLDDLSASQARAYAGFLQQVPWYKWDFRADADALTAAQSRAIRDRERAIALGIEYRVKAAYAGVIARAVAAVGPDELTLRMIVKGLSPTRLGEFEGVRVFGEHAEGIEVETPRYRALTHLLADMSKAGAEFVEIAGNGTIMLTAITTSELEGALASFDRQGYADKRSLILLPVGDLAGWMRAHPGAVEHIHDY